MRTSAIFLIFLTLLIATEVTAQAPRQESSLGFPPASITVRSSTSTLATQFPCATCLPTAERPRVSAGIVVLQVFAGIVGAWAGGVAAYSLAESVANDRTVSGNVAFIVGSALGSTLGVYTVGYLGKVRGSLLATAAGAGLPSLALFFGVGDPYMPLYGVIFVAPLQAGGAAIGFNITGR